MSKSKHKPLTEGKVRGQKKDGKSKPNSPPPSPTPIEIPILENHNPKRVVGGISFKSGYIAFWFNDKVEITDEMFFSIFGCGAVFDEVVIDGNKRLIKSGKIYEFSLNTIAEAKIK